MQSQLISEGKEIMRKWEATDLLKGINDPWVKLTTSVLLDNQVHQNKKLLTEAGTDTSDIANFKKISIPLIRRVYPQLIANKIVSVQPLLGPTGLVYYMRFRYSSNKGSVRGADNNSGFPTDDSNSLQQTASGDTNLAVEYTSQLVSNEQTSTDAGTSTTTTYSPLEHTPIIAGTMTGQIVLNGNIIQTFTVSEAGVFTFSSIGTQAVRATSGTLNVNDGELSFTWNSAPSADNYATVSYEYNMECNPDLPEINLTIESESVTAKIRKLKAKWSFEAQQDVRSQHNLDLEEEITAIMSQEINLEIDREVLTDLLNNAGTISAWDYSTALGDTVKERYESLYVKLMEVSAVIHRKTLRGAANWIVCSPEVASLFETSVAGFAPTNTEGFESSLGVQYVGTVNKKFALYKDPNFKVNQILLGYKGDSYMDSGYFYMPYVPLTQTPVVINPETLCPVRGILTRYGKKLLRDGSKFFARVSVQNLNI